MAGWPIRKHLEARCPSLDRSGMSPGEGGGWRHPSKEAHAATGLCLGCREGGRYRAGVLKGAQYLPPPRAET